MASTVRKVSVAIGREELAWAERRARQQKTSVSAVLTAAARKVRDDERAEARRRKAWDELLDWATDGKGLSEEEIEQGRRELDGA